MEEIGRIHSIETFSTVDGPGIRIVIFLQGCFLNCIYCHNPDSWDIKAGKNITVQEIVKKIEEYRVYIKNGGITLSGGEPLLQPVFVSSLLENCRKKGIHTAIETSGGVVLKDAVLVLKNVDLLILDLKGLNEKDCSLVCNISIENSINILKYCEDSKKSVWIRHVLVPKITLDFEKLKRIAKFLKKFSCIKRVELLPFHKMGEYKWRELKFLYTLEKTKEPSKEEIEKSLEIFRKEGLNVI